MATMTFTITGEVNVAITLTELPDGSIEFTLNVLNDTGSIGDLNGMFFDLFDDSLTNTLLISGADITGTALKVDGVTRVDSYNTINGEIVKDFGKFDGGVQFGTSGIGMDDIRTTTFTIASTDGPLTLSDFALQDFAVRLTSVGAEDGTRDGSLKLGGTAPEAPIEQVATNIANNDVLQVTELEGWDVDGFDFLTTGEGSVLANDTTDDGAAYSGVVVSANGLANGVTLTDPVILEGSLGGHLILNADGSFDFSTTGADGINDFAYLDMFEIAETVFTYGIEGGSTAELTVRVLGFSDSIGGPLPPLPPLPPIGESSGSDLGLTNPDILMV